MDFEELNELIEANCPNPLIVPGTTVPMKRPAVKADVAEPSSEAGGAAG